MTQFIELQVSNTSVKVIGEGLGYRHCCIVKTNACFPPKSVLGYFRVPNAETGTQTTCNVHGQRESNTSVPNANYIPLDRVGSVGARVGSVVICVGSARLFRYQHVGIRNEKVSRWGDYPL